MSREDLENREELEIEEQGTGSIPEDVDTVLDEDENVIAGEVPEEVEEESFYANLAERLDDQTLARLGSDLVADYEQDKRSRQEWVDTYIKGLDLLGFKYESPTRPFLGAAGVTHPLLAESATQFQAQAIKELVPSDGPVRTEVIGAQTDEKIDQASRVKDYMNYMLMNKMEEYTPDMDQMLFILPLTGSTFKKVYFDPVLNRASSKFIKAEDLVVPYNASDLSDASRITQIIQTSENDLRKLQVSGFYRDVELPKPVYKQNKVQEKVYELEGVSANDGRDRGGLYNLIEVHTNLDIPGYEDQDGIKVPYIVTIDEDSRKVLSIYRNYRENDPMKQRKNFFVHYKFLPGLGFYGFGLIHMIGGLSRTATSALRQLLDAGTLSNLPAGFKSRGLRIRDDAEPLQPGEFRDVDAPGGNIKDQFQFLPFKGPDQTLFQLLNFCVESGRRFASIADMKVSDMNAQSPVGTTMAILERGSKVMSAIHKRCYYAMRQEFKMLAQVFADYLPPEYPYDVVGGNRFIKQADFDDRVDVIPVADPDIYSMTQRIQVAQAELQLAQSNPQMHDIHEAYKRMYQALGVKNINGILKPPPEPPKPLDPAIENTGALQMVIPKAFPQQDHEAHIQAHMAFMTSRMVQVNPQIYGLLQGHLMEHISLQVKQEILQAFNQDPRMAELQSTDEEAFTIEFDNAVAQRIAQRVQELVTMEQQFTAQQNQDPLLALKQKELDLRAMDINRKAQEEAQKMEFEANKFSAQQTLAEDKLNLNEELGKKRVELQEEKLEQEKNRAPKQER
jgi:hypothetical protein